MKIKILDWLSKIVSLIVAILIVGIIALVGYSLYVSLNISDSPKEDFCGWSTYGNCIYDSDCIVSGCSSQICQSKEEGAIITTCEWKDCYDAENYNLKCKCIEGKCQWSK
jgi:eight-cysteine-cluster-containing protein